MKETFYLKLNVYLILLIIPLSILGYYFAVNNESLYFLYEWLLTGLVIVSVIFSIKNIISIKTNLKWVAISIFIFLIQFSVLGLFLGPITHYAMIYVYYVCAAVSIGICMISLRKSKKLRSIPISFIVVTGLFSLYMVSINMLWGNSLN